MHLRIAKADVVVSQVQKTNVGTFLIRFEGGSEKEKLILNKQVNLFTTNVDVFLEKSLENTNVEYNDGFSESFESGFVDKIKMNGIPDKLLSYYNNGNYISLMKGAMDFADAFIMGEEKINDEVLEYAQASGKPILDYQGDEDYFDAYNQFYDQIIEAN